MANMSYCRFENTVKDIKECIEAFDEGNWDLDAMIESASSWQERKAMKKFIELCKDVAEAFSEDEDE